MREGISDEIGRYKVVREGRRTVVVELIGEHDLATATAVREVLVPLAAANDLLVVDLSPATFIDSSVLLSLVQAKQTAEDCGAVFRVQLGSASIVDKALEVSGLSAELDVRPTRDEALRGFESGER